MPFTTIKINTPPPYLTLSSDENLPVVMTVAGSDSSGGAGIEADIKTITAHRCYGMTCATALTAQTPAEVFGVHPIPKDFIAKILDVNLRDMKCNTIKTGMLTVEAVDVLSSKLRSLSDNDKPKLIVDPVLVATSGSALGSTELVKAMKADITPLAYLLTPNIPECFELVGEKTDISSINDLCQLAKRVSEETNCANVLVKGGHNPWNDAQESYITDVLYVASEQKCVVYKGNYINTTHTHGTGCTLASAIASNVARGYSLCQAVYGGIEYVQNGVTIGCEVTKDHITNNGPINHVYAVEIPLEKMVTDECFTGQNVIPKAISDGKKHIEGEFFDYLINHPKVKPHWDSYVHHDFVKQVANGTLKREKFRFFIEQDYAYLIDYAKVHCVAGSKAPSLEDIEKELVIVSSVRNEMGQHEKRLKEEFGVKDNGYFQKIKRGPALNNYSRYFNDIARRGNWQELVASLSPCLMGYGHALLNHKKYITVKEGDVYHEWCETYLSIWYQDAMTKGKGLLNQIAQTYPQEQLDILVTIFADVCELETKFWDAAVNYVDGEDNK